ncbi:MAG: hypothetical protein QOD99_1981 [Chthoniobacter sp.]|jgi:tripartite-type tricarboxylate transporter receptor subunit TctC|nr:hypothetical protein [Chthoniobacter sp.]
MMKMTPFLCSILVVGICAGTAVAAPRARSAAAAAIRQHSGSAPEKRAKLKAAREKAMKDPKVKEAAENLAQANKHFWEIVAPLLLAEDPSLQSIIDKVKDAADDTENADSGRPGLRAGRGAFLKGLASLTPEERQKLKAAQEKIKDNPDVRAARQKRQEAAQEFRKVLHDAMVAADPSIASDLEKLEQSSPDHPSA